MSARPTSGKPQSRPPAAAKPFSPITMKPTKRTSPNFWPSPPDNPSSIRSCIEVARHNARAVRTALTTEMWETINGAWLELNASAMGRPRGRNFCASCDWVQETSLRFDGSAYRTMLRNDVYWFSRLGLYHRARRQHGAHPRREIPHAAAGRRTGGRPARLLSMGRDPAHGLGARRPTIGSIAKASSRGSLRTS